MNTLNHSLQSVSTPRAEYSMNTSQPTKPNRKPPGKRMLSGALMRRDQDLKGHNRIDPVDGGARASASAGRYGEFGTIGARLTSPSR